MPKSHIFTHCVDCGSEFLTRRKPTPRTGGVRRVRCYRCEAKRWHRVGVLLSAFGCKEFSYASAER